MVAVAGVNGTVDLVVPIKPLQRAKSRLRGALGNDHGDLHSHARLVLALARDTVLAARAARSVRRLLVISSDPVVAAELADGEVDVVPDPATTDTTDPLNHALHHGSDLLRAADPAATVGVLQADLPALRPAELDAAITAASGLTRAFCADATGSGTTLLLAAPGVDLRPAFGAGSAQRHRRSGATPLNGDWPGLRRDVDTLSDLEQAAELGLGPYTRSLLAARAQPHPATRESTS